ncbi:hypothetical protein [Rhizobium sp. AG855]|nr:hypothetical protein [Rhizobium sp. AG855]
MKVAVEASTRTKAGLAHAPRAVRADGNIMFCLQQWKVGKP